MSAAPQMTTRMHPDEWQARFGRWSELNAAVDRPTTELQGPTPAARCSSVRPGGNGSDNSQISAHPNLKQQLHDLIKEFE